MGTAPQQGGSSKRPHALAIPLPLLGHINPMMQLARKLASNGFIITLVNLASNHDKLLQAQQQQDGLDIRLESVPDRVPVPVARLDIFSSSENRSIFRRAYQAMESDVEELLLRDRLNPPVSCIIGDAYFNWIARVADRSHLPTVIFSTASASSLLIDHYIPRLLATGDIPVQDSDENDDQRPVAADLPGMPAGLHIADLPHYLGAESMDTGFGGRFEKAQSIAGCEWVLVNSCEALEPGAFKALQASLNPNIVGIGPLLPSSSSAENPKKNSSPNAAWSEDRECLAWLDGKPSESVLYISFGSLATMPPEQFVELAKGLVASKQAFLWAVRPNLLVGHEFEPLAEATWALLKEQGNACLVPWAPQLEVLGHPSVGGFLTHCGWNSLLEGICCGVPFLGWPQVVEQNLNCRIACGEWNIGSRMPTTRSSKIVGRCEIAESIKALMVGEQGKAMRANVRALREVVMNGAGDRNLDAFTRCF